MPKREQNGLTRRGCERERHRLEMLAAAERVFAHRGYQTATVDEIASEAEFAVGTIYNFFKSKEELYIQVVKKHVQDIMELLEERVIREPDAETAIAALIDIRLAHFYKHRDLFRSFLETSPGNRFDPAGALPKECAGLYEQYIEAVAGIFARGAPGDRRAESDPLYLALCLEGAINASVAYWTMREPEQPHEARVQKIQKAFLGSLCGRQCAGGAGKPGRARSAVPEGGGQGIEHAEIVQEAKGGT